MSILVRHAMTESPRTADADATVREVAEIMRDSDIGAVPVLENGVFKGIVTDRDLVTRVIAEHAAPEATPIAQVFSPQPATVTPDQELSEARDLMSSQQIRRLAVVKGEEVVGMLSFGDVARTDASSRAVGEAIEAISEDGGLQLQGHEVGDPERGTPERVRNAAAQEGG